MKNYNFEKLEPRGVLSWFKRICAIPHGSHNEAALAEFLKTELDKAGCQIKQFSSGAIYARKAATKGFEKRPTVMIQAHMDMVCVHKPELKIDMAKEAIKPYFDSKDGCIKCDGTTLGADNGIGVATIMEIMTSNKYQHGPLEALLTVCEETDITYCMNSIPDRIFKAKHLLNLDNDIPDKMYVSSNGAMKVCCEKRLEFKPVDKGTKTYSVQIYHLEGGHSALMIHNPGSNAIKLLCEALYSFTQDHARIRFVSFDAGTAMNSIPARAEMHIQMNPKDLPELKKHIQHALDIAIELSQGIDKNGKSLVKLANVQAKKACTIDDTERTLLFYSFVPTGIYRMDLSMKHIFAAGNIGTVRTNGDILETVLLPRSFSEKDLEKQFADICYIGKLLGMNNFKKQVTCPPWLTPYPDKVEIIKAWIKCYQKATGKYPLPVKDPGGIEPSALVVKNPQLKNHSVSVGPRIYDGHSVREKVDVSTIKTFFNVLLSVLKEIK